MMAAAATQRLRVDIGAVGQSIARRIYNEVLGGAAKARWLGIEGAMDDAIRSLGLTYDLTVVERLDEEQSGQVRAFNTALFETGAPVLLTPPDLEGGLGTVAAVIWNGSRQSARAMRSSIPLLGMFERFCLFTNFENSQADPHDAVEYLGFHGIQPEVRYYDGSGLTARAGDHPSRALDRCRVHRHGRLRRQSSGCTLRPRPYHP